MASLPPLTPEERAAIHRGRWFMSLPATARHDLLRLAKVGRFEDGELVNARGILRTAWFACAAGTLRVSRSTRAGRLFTLAYVRPGVWFGGAAVFDGGTSTHDMHAIGRTSVLSVGREDFQALLLGSPELGAAVLKLQAHHIRGLYGSLDSLNSPSIELRIARQLLILARSHGVPTGNEAADAKAVRIELPLTQTALAEMVGYSRQRVNGALKRLERDGVLALTRQGIVIRDATRLDAMSDR